MSLVEAINFFSSYGADECYILVNKNGKYYINKNYSINRSICTTNLSDGIYFEMLAGDVEDSNNTNQFFSLRIKNPNSITLPGPYKVIFYSSTNQPIHTINMTSLTNNLEISYQAVGQQVSYIVLYANNKVIYSTEDIKRNLIPLDQRFSVSYYTPFNEYIAETYLFRNKNEGLYFSDPTYRTVSIFLASDAISSNKLVLLYNNIGVGSNKLSVLSEYKVPSQYRFLFDNIKYSLTSYSILSYLFLKDLLKSLNSSLIEDWPYYNELEKANNILPYERYYYDEFQVKYVPINTKVNILDILLAIYFSSKKQSLLFDSYNIHKQIFQYLKTFSLNNSFYPKAPVPSNNLSILPDSISFNTNTNEFNNPDSYSLGTNLLFLSILSANFEDINPLIREIERIFLEENVVTWTLNEQKTNIEDPLQAAIIKAILSAYRYLFSNTYQNLIDQIINSAEQYLVNNYSILTRIEINGNFNSTTYNPLYDLTINYLKIYTKEIYKNIYISFFLGEDIEKYRELGIDNVILDSIVYDPSNYKLILPSLRATLALYQLPFIFAHKEEIMRTNETIELVTQDTRIAGNLLISTIELSKPTKIIAILKINNQPVSYITSLNPSSVHTIQFSSSLLSSQNYAIEIYPIL